MSQADVSYSCGSCGYHLNLTSSNRVTSSIGSKYSKSINKGFISFLSIDPSRFTQVDKLNCLPISWGAYRSKSKLLCRNCGVLIGYGYGDSTALCGLDSPTSSGSSYKKIVRLDSGSDRESFGLTCHRWLCIQNSSRRSLQFQCSFTQLRPILLSQPSTSISSFHLYRLLNRYRELQSLSLSGCTELPDAGLSLLINYGLKLQSLHLDCCFGITDHGLSFVAMGCPFLTDLSLYRCNITDTGLETLSEFCLALKGVNLSYCSLISDRGIRALTQNCQQLRAINISHCRSVDGIGFQGCSRTLAYIEADSCKFVQKGIRAIVSGGGLEYLNISNLSWCIRGHGFGAIDTGSISKLRVLNFRLGRTIGDDAVVKIAQGCPLLQEWNLALCHEISLIGWESIGSNCCNLERLHVNRCRNLCDQGLQALRDGCKRLQKLYLGQCCRVSWTAIEMFKMSRGDVLITDDEIMCIAPDWAF